jgi:hypothetical protein
MPADVSSAEGTADRASFAECENVSELRRHLVAFESRALSRVGLESQRYIENDQRVSGLFQRVAQLEQDGRARNQPGEIVRVRQEEPQTFPLDVARVWIVREARQLWDTTLVAGGIVVLGSAAGVGVAIGVVGALRFMRAWFA